MRPRRRAALAWAAWAAIGGCAWPGGSGELGTPYRHNRVDYGSFRAAHPDLLEPNYLPFMVHRVPGDEDRGDILVFCRWPREAMPIPVYIEVPAIPESLQDEFAPRDPALYVQAVESALDTWARELEGHVGFRRVADPADAKLELRLVGEEAPEPNPDLRVFGVTRMAQACRIHGRDSGADRLEVGYEVSELDLYLADRYGLLSPDQVEWIALHEIGHALGMRSHSPIPADLMYEVARDRVTVRGLSIEDVNSFVSLYELPNGAIYTRIAPDGIEPPAPPPAAIGPPKLALAPYVNPRRGFEFRPPSGWTRVETTLGMVAVDGPTWDYTASFQVIVQSYPTIDAYLERYAPYYLSRGRLLRTESLVVHGRPALQALIEHEDRGLFEEITLIESGDGRVVVVIAECPAEAVDAYRPLFRRVLGSLEIVDFPARRDRAGSGVP